jgi:citrate synthase
MSILKAKLAKRVPELRERYRRLVKEHGTVRLSEVTVEALYGGLRGVKGLLCDTSSVPPEKGLLIRGIPIGELADRLPEELWHLLLLGELPGTAELEDLHRDWTARSRVPETVFAVLEAMHANARPMTMLATALLVLERDSVFRARYQQMHKDDYWEAAFEDASNLLAKLPQIAAWIYRIRFDKGKPIEPDPALDWGANLARMTGLADPGGELTRLMRLYLTLHCDHEGGNVSAFTAHTVGSALSDLYYSLSAGFAGLAGPLHGLANQECLDWILKTIQLFGGPPTEEQVASHARWTLDSGHVIPGYGHAVLRVVDPRFTALLNFGLRHCPSDPAVLTVSRVFKVVPEVLQRVQKVKDPWPNVDAVSGALLHHYGMTEISFYTVPFAISRALGISAQYILSRAIGSPIMRPKSVTGEEVERMVASS